MGLDLERRFTDTPHQHSDVEKDWQEFWLSSLGEGFTLNNIKAELRDYHTYLTETAKVYVEITNGRVSKQNTTAEAVIGEYRAVLQQTVDEAIEDATAELKSELEDVTGDNEKLRAFIRELMSGYADSNLDGGEVQEIAVRHNILAETTQLEPCGEGCRCNDFYASDEFPVTCYRYTTLVNDEGVALPPPERS